MTTTHTDGTHTQAYGMPGTLINHQKGGDVLIHIDGDPFPSYWGKEDYRLAEENESGPWKPALIEHPKHELYLNAGKLRAALEGLSDDAPVYVQRIEDVYFDKHGWSPDVQLDLTHSRDDSVHGDYNRPWGPFRISKDDALYLAMHY